MCEVSRRVDRGQPWRDWIAQDRKREMRLDENGLSINGCGGERVTSELT